MVKKPRPREPETEPEVVDQGEAGSAYASPPWTYDGQPFDPAQHPDAKAFVYVITNALDGRKYVGKKLLTRAKTLPPLKGKKRKRRSRVESNWREYWGSSEELCEDVERIGPERFTREVVVLCNSSGEASYFEAELQFRLRVLLRQDEFYNRQVRCRVHASHLKKVPR